jgi:hypothetical protein
VSMRICEHHERRMRSICCDLGLQFRISRDAAHLAARRARNDRFDVDPLDLMQRSIMGLGAAVVRNNGIDPAFVGCPLCFFNEEAMRAGWVDNVAKAVQEKITGLESERRADQERNRELEEAVRSA